MNKTDPLLKGSGSYFFEGMEEKQLSKIDDFLNTLYKKSGEIDYYTNKENVELFAEALYKFLFLIEEKSCHSFLSLKLKYKTLRIEFIDIINDFLPQEDAETVGDFFDDILPKLYSDLEKDAQFFIESDPAATSLREIQVSYPGFFTIVIYRLAHELWRKGIPLLPRLLTEYAHGKTGIDIHPGAKIGVPFMIDHGTGIVIGETAVIGNQVKIYQRVTLGALSVSVDKANTKRHPTIGNDVVIYSGATILGGDTHIGERCIIGGNVWLTHSIDPDSKVFHKSQIIVKDSEIKEEPINFMI